MNVCTFRVGESEHVCAVQLGDCFQTHFLQNKANCFGNCNFRSNWLAVLRLLKHLCIKTSSSCVWAVVMAQDGFSLSTAERERCQELCALLTECIQGRQTEMIREQSSFSILTSLFCLLCQSSLCFFVYSLPLLFLKLFSFSSRHGLMHSGAVQTLQAWSKSMRNLRGKALSSPCQTLRPCHPYTHLSG